MILGLRVVGSTEGNEREDGTYEKKVTEGEERRKRTGREWLRNE